MNALGTSTEMFHISSPRNNGAVTLGKPGITPQVPDRGVVFKGFAVVEQVARGKGLWYTLGATTVWGCP